MRAILLRQARQLIVVDGDLNLEQLEGESDCSPPIPGLVLTMQVPADVGLLDVLADAGYRWVGDDWFQTPYVVTFDVERAPSRVVLEPPPRVTP